ncbi:MAG: 16S rRNA (guanine(527)-N(7))-methyltransferase RsmG [Deltaproteobacteria bacterium]|nr:16S rRNA (guanine(527)-N(7))-methyltransferase RsmG [Deltaproteobacteria bacterium]
MSRPDPWAALRAVRADVDGDRLESYAREIERWNRAIRLVGPKDLPGIRVQVVDAVLPFLLFSPAFPLLDIGSGAGLPGIPIAVAYPEGRVVCLEPLAKRVSFLRHAVRHLRLGNVRIAGGKAEQAVGEQPELRAAFAMVTARAVADPAVVLALGAPFLSAAGRVVLLRGREQAPEVPGWQLLDEGAYEGPVGVGERRRFVYVRVEATTKAG